MATDDERREMARKLRACESNIDAAGWFWLNDELGGVHVVASSEERLRRGTTRLADLIDPPYPDATAIYKGWRAEVYDPDGVLVSPSNLAADLVRAHADGKRLSEPEVRCVAEVKVDGKRLEELVHDAAVELTGIDRDELLAQVKELEKCAWYFGLDFDADEPLRDRLKEASEDFAGCARRIREALGESDG